MSDLFFRLVKVIGVTFSMSGKVGGIALAVGGVEMNPVVVDAVVVIDSSSYSIRSTSKVFDSCQRVKVS